MKENRPTYVKKQASAIDIDALFAGITGGNRTMLAKGITLIESNAAHHFAPAQELLQRCLPNSGRSMRIGISGVPGAGKSTFIEYLGTALCNQGHRVAVLAIDPSSSLTGGSILGDKTRMEKLSGLEGAFIRPSPSEGTLGGVHRKTRESMILCEAAGYDIVLIETVGVGQSEAIVRGMSDFFMLLAITGAGDELQGMKKGIMELTDAIVVNKADGDNIRNAKAATAEYNRILHFLQPATEGWKTKAYACSSLDGTGMEELWKAVLRFFEKGSSNGSLDHRRKQQTKEWMRQSLAHRLNNWFYSNPTMKELLPTLEQKVMEGGQTVSTAVEEALNLFKSSLK
ncbi:methylmalonyl Co-A mutase-associated GTPase MeaB [Bacillus testis]|uniref:methylmalonyl Co-A mutase-associated GTPase MeaB n=1 Tax=Bacillus testis TaxID=1622072 RepID=UPI00067EF09D|nr:methylmalonyl Co-A mutase-associated GTPase MeaB [Bacillus testis]